jgi:quercetin dioxygenase-like cupin family protein
MYKLGNLRELLAAVASAGEGEPPPVGRRINGRLVAVLASPDLGNATHLAAGLSVLGPGVSTPTHSHLAEEVAVIISGSGRIVVGGTPVAVREGDIVLAPPGAPHRTEADGDCALHVLWCYSPAGSEARWLADDPEER